MREVERSRVAQILDFLGERIGQARESAHLHPHRQVLALHKAKVANLCRTVSNHNA